MFVVRNEWTGEHYIGQLAWSGGYAFEFDLCNGSGDLPVSPRLFFRAGVDAPPPLRMIAPGETITTPEMHLGMVIGDLDTAVQAMHDHVRTSVMLPQPRGRGCWVEAAAAGDLFELTPELVHHCIDIGADIGAEVFFIDAGWYANRNTYWATTREIGRAHV
jgi:alpha-galactosidase